VFVGYSGERLLLALRKRVVASRVVTHGLDPQT
jgi:hypothetical protein